MAIKPQQKLPHNGDVPDGNDRVKWILGALGLLWLARIAVSALRSTGVGGSTRKSGSVKYEASRLDQASAPHGRPLPPPTHGHESRDANVKWIFGIVAFLLVSVVVIHGIMAFYLNALKRGPLPTDPWRPHEASMQASTSHPTLPKLQVAPPLELQAFRAREQEELNTYGWIDRTNGIVRVPIDEAMELMLREGFPTRKGTNEYQAGISSYQLIEQRLAHREPEVTP